MSWYCSATFPGMVRVGSLSDLRSTDPGQPPASVGGHHRPLRALRSAEVAVVTPPSSPPRWSASRSASDLYPVKVRGGSGESRVSESARNQRTVIEHQYSSNVINTYDVHANLSTLIH